MCLYREEAALLEREQNRSQQGDFGRAAQTHTKVKGQTRPEELNITALTL